MAFLVCHYLERNWNCAKTSIDWLTKTRWRWEAATKKLHHKNIKWSATRFSFHLTLLRWWSSARVKLLNWITAKIKTCSDPRRMSMTLEITEERELQKHPRDVKKFRSAFHLLHTFRICNKLKKDFIELPNIK